jgi:hypothetical protein
MTTDNEGPSAASVVRHEAEGPRITDALYQAFPNKPTMMGIDPADGLPRAVVPHAWKDAQAPELLPEKFVCMGDFSKFVARDKWGRIVAEFTPAEVTRQPVGVWTVPQPLFHERAGDGYLSNPSLLQQVEPLRPQCHHYARQLVPFPEDIEHSMVARLCTARRTDEGEFLDLGNQQILACELRAPAFGNEQAQLEAFDARTIAAQQKKKAEEVSDDFDVDAALGAQTTTKGT